ncbi:MAG: 4-hydroxythreonine-4-phosphate dehydrogenase PdxA [Verrucomicrobiota bacterium]
MTQPTPPQIALTMGDPAGVGPEICLDILADAELGEVCQPIIYGDLEVLTHCAKTTRRPAPDPTRILSLTSGLSFNPGTPSATTGQASFQYLETAITHALSGQVQAVTTAPISKDAWHAANINYPGHTEVFTSLTNSSPTCMAFFSQTINASLVTVHLPLREVPLTLTTERIKDVIALTRQALQQQLHREPHLTILGLNPHASENGLFGDEESRLIQPAIEHQRSLGANLSDPLPPDTAFLPSHRKQTDGYIAMYHDQALIPVKTLAFDTAVNTTLGLPFPRTSVDHGTALDIAWQKKANPRSLREAILLAAKLTEFAPPL